MQIDLPQDLIKRVQNRATAGGGLTEADVIRKALDALDWHTIASGRPFKKASTR
jgi:hypothetical protein